MKQATTKPTKKTDWSYALGRRRTATARVRLFKGDKESTVNGEVIGKYFTGAAMSRIWQKPFTLTSTLGKYYITAKVAGGGKKGQLNAVLHGISRTLLTLDDGAHRTTLKAAGLLKRDSRKRQRRMIGTGGKARRKKSSPKR